MTAGFSALAAAMLIDPRRTLGHIGSHANNIPFVILGAVLLWFWMVRIQRGLGARLRRARRERLHRDEYRSRRGSFTWTFLSWAESKKPSAMAAATGAVCGALASYHPPHQVSSDRSPVLPSASSRSVITYAAVYIRMHKIGVDDTVDVSGRLTAWEASRARYLRVSLRRRIINAAGNNGLLFRESSTALDTDRGGRGDRHLSVHRDVTHPQGRLVLLSRSVSLRRMRRRARPRGTWRSRVSTLALPREKLYPPALYGPLREIYLVGRA